MEESRLSDHPENTYCAIDEAAGRKEFLLHARVLAALHLAEKLRERKGGTQEPLYCLTPEAVLVNTENGDIRLLDEQCQKCCPTEENTVRERGCFLRCLAEEDSEGLEEAEIVRFAVYAAFRLLCVDDPLDGRETLINYPYLSERSIDEIHHGDYGFICSDSSNSFSEYIGAEASVRWKVLPGFLQRRLKQAFTFAEIDGEKEEDLDEWLFQMRKLRDCLVYVNKQFRLCDPEVSNRVMFLEMTDYKVPVWPRKALYWYHVGVDFEEQSKGIVGGVMQEDYLENRSRFEWIVEFGRKKLILHPGESIKVETGMLITIEDTEVRVINGEVV